MESKTMGEHKVEKKVVHTLSGPEQFKLCQSILRNHEGVILPKSMSMEEAASWYSEALGFKVTKHNLQTAYEAVEVPWKSQRGGRSNGGKDGPAVHLARALIHLYNAFSMPVPYEIECIARKLSITSQRPQKDS